MIVLGALFILSAFSCWGMGEITPGFVAALIGSALIAYGIHRNKMKQSQTQQQTVIVNNYTGQTQETEPKLTLAEIAEQRKRELAQKKLEEEKTAEKLPPKEPAAKLSVTAVRDGYAVAGVTFRNDDGTSRQKILRELCDGEDFVSVPVELEPFDYKGEPAIRVLSPDGCVGNIHREDVAEVLELLNGSPKDIYMDINSFENENGKTIFRGDVHIDD